jgi:hypothetical protein
MTATQMYEAFLNEANQSNTNMLLSQDVAYWLNQAQRELFNRFFYQEKEKGAPEASPRSYFQGTLKIAEDLAPFETMVEDTTSRLGFLATPSNLCRTTAVYLHIQEEDDCGDLVTVEHVPASLMRDTTLAAQSNNYYHKPRWDDRSVAVGRFNPYFRFSNRQSSNGIQILPRGQYRVTWEYIQYPPNIEIANPAWESQYEGNPEFVATATDVDSLFPVDRHDEIVQTALTLFLKSRPDYQGYQMEESSVSRGDA